MNCVRFGPHRTRVFYVTRLPCKTPSHTFANNYRLRKCSITNGSGAHSHTFKCCRPLWFVRYHRRLPQEWRVLFVWDPTRFLKEIRLGLYFALGTVYSQFSCAITRYHKRFQRPYAHVLAQQIVCDLLCITDGSAMIDICFLMWIAHTHLVEPCAEQLPG